QAEDGIRDFHVTGVQTCALPICEWVTTQSEMIPSGAGDPLEASRDVDQAFSDAIHEARISGQPDTAPIGRAGGATPQTNPEHERSEERRVGKQRRYRGSAEHEKK